MLKFNKKALIILLVVTITALIAGCSAGSGTPDKAGNSQPAAKDLAGEVVIFHAGSLAVPFDQMEKEFEQMHPKVDVKREAAGSRECAKKVTDLGKKADIIASADYYVIDEMLIPNHANWNVLFAKNQMVLMHTGHSKYKDEINSNNWPEILLKEDVQYGHSDPNADPCGYRALMVWQLAEKHYNIPDLYKKLDEKRPERNIRPKETDCIAMLESGALDYLFIYRSVAEQHKLPYVELPPEVNLSDINKEAYYKQATVKTTGKKPGEFVNQIGMPIVYGVTMVKDAPNNENAIEFMKYLLDKEKGLKIMEENGQPVENPLIIKEEESLPDELKSFLKK